MGTMVRERRLALRLTADADDLIRSAASIEGTTVTDFTTTAAVAKARETLSDQLRVTLTPTAWDAFTAALDEPAATPRLDRLLAEPSVFER